MAAGEVMSWPAVSVDGGPAISPPAKVAADIFPDSATVLLLLTILYLFPGIGTFFRLQQCGHFITELPGSLPVLWQLCSGVPAHCFISCYHQVLCPIRQPACIVGPALELPHWCHVWPGDAPGELLHSLIHTATLIDCPSPYLLNFFYKFAFIKLLVTSFLYILSTNIY